MQIKQVSIFPANCTRIINIYIYLLLHLTKNNMIDWSFQSVTIKVTKNSLKQTVKDMFKIVCR